MFFDGVLRFLPSNVTVYFPSTKLTEAFFQKRFIVRSASAWFVSTERIQDHNCNSILAVSGTFFGAHGSTLLGNLKSRRYTMQ